MNDVGKIWTRLAQDFIDSTKMNLSVDDVLKSYVACIHCNSTFNIDISNQEFNRKLSKNNIDFNIAYLFSDFIHKNLVNYVLN